MRPFRSIWSSRRPIRLSAGHPQRGQSLVEVALLLIPLLLIAGLGGDLARMFFVSQSVTNAAREGALFATQHGSESTETQAALTTGILSIMGAEDQGSNSLYHCPSWPAAPGSPPNNPNGGVQVTYVGSIPPAAGATTTVTITANCNVNPVLGAFWPLPKPVKLKTVIQAQTLSPS